jgi:glycosyltransferase involved in cell wall biosynthesis
MYKKTVAVLTDFYEADPTYSLNIVIEEQLAMLLRHGYQPVAITEDIFKPARVWENVTLRHFPAYIPRGNVVNFHDKWEDDVSRLHVALREALTGIDVVLTHDLIYQPSSLWLNMAARKVAMEREDITWLNWVHSATPSEVWTQSDPRLGHCQTHFPRSKTIYPNSYSINRVATNFRCEVDQVSIVPHSTNVCEYLGFDPLTTRLVSEKRILDADAILVYPIRLDRGKQVEYVLRTAAEIKRLDRTVRVIIVDFHSTGGDKVTYRKSLQEAAIDIGLNDTDLTFTSQFTPEWKTRVPRNVVRDLMLLCNIFVMPSRSETYSLITQEAGLCGAFLVLNRDFPPMRDIYGAHAAFYQFSSNIDIATGLDGETNTAYADIGDYFQAVALRCIYEMENNPVLAQQARIRKERNPDYIFRRFIEPLFHAFGG